MGVKDLWSILAPSGERKPLYELHGKTVAIDLSSWIVDSQTVTLTNMYLRNIFFRTSTLLLNNVLPVFVLEGKAPVIKYNTIAKRNKVAYEGKKKSKNAGRSRFNFVLKECEEMLNYIGVACIRAYGEAEATCAHLNEDGLVDGCISQDSDCFLYGAKKVYRNFCTTTKGMRTTSSGSIDEYSMEKIENLFHLGRNKMIALALLCGCDYDDGVHGIGKEAALKFFSTIEDNEILNRMTLWRTTLKSIEKETQIVCEKCGITAKCSNTCKETILSYNEIAVKNKALLNENFPNQELIDEFLFCKKLLPSKSDLKWRKPKIFEFIHFMKRKGLWESDYAFNKIFPLVTRWQIKNLIQLPMEKRLNLSNIFIPEKIKKKRNIHSTASYEILWIDKDDLLIKGDIIVPSTEKESELVTIEPQDVILKCYPNLVETFNTLNNKKISKSRSKKQVMNNDDESSKNSNIKAKKSYRKKDVKIVKNKKILDFLIIKNHEQEHLNEQEFCAKFSEERDKKHKNDKMSILNQKVPKDIIKNEQLISIESLDDLFSQLTVEDFATETDNFMDMSTIIENICKKKN